MGDQLTTDLLLAACADDSSDAALRFDAELEPIGGPGSPVSPPTYEGGFQADKRWASVDAEQPVDVISMSNNPDGANRVEEANRRAARALGLPELVLDLSGIETLPPHVPAQLSSWQFPHRAADAYLRDAEIDGVDLLKTEVGRNILNATPWTAGPLLAWFPQALAHGFWQSHLGKKRSNAKHARAWTSEIIGWNPAVVSDHIRRQGLKGDPLNLSIDEKATSNPDDQTTWEFGKGTVKDGKADKLSNLGHGQVPFMGGGAGALAGVSFTRITQQATLSFPQLRRVSLGTDQPDHDAAARALVAAVALHGHVAAFGRPFALRSGADLVPVSQTLTHLGGAGATALDLPSLEDARALVTTAIEHARSLDLPLDGWGREPLRLTPKAKLADAIRSTWPLGDL